MGHVKQILADFPPVVLLYVPAGQEVQEEESPCVLPYTVPTVYVPTGQSEHIVILAGTIRTPLIGSLYRKYSLGYADT